MKHVILAKEPVGEARIVWDDAAGTVDGDHSFVPELRRKIENGPVTLGCPHGSLDLADPGHDAADFLTALYSIVGWPRKFELPASLADVVPTPYPPLPDTAGEEVDY